jgi:hypothetical protein
MKYAHTITAALLAALACAGCSRHEVKTAERSASPLIGTWIRDGDTPKPNAGGPEFTQLTFAADGSLTAKYVAGGGLAAIGAAAPKEKTENDTYRTGSATLRIAEGSTERAYDFRVSGGKLYLTPHGDANAAVFSKTASS